MTEQITVGVDLGGTNLRVAAFGDLNRLAAETPQPIAEHYERVTRDHRLEAVTAQLCDAVDTVVNQARGRAPTDAKIRLGIGLAAMLGDRDGLVKCAPHFGWRDVAFGAAVRERLGATYTLAVNNDVNAVLFGEYCFGAGRGAASVLGVYVGTGVGGGLIVDGKLVHGASYCAGEIGHTKVALGKDAPLCACGLRGCLEAYVGGSYLQKRIRRDVAQGVSTMAAQLTGGELIELGHVDAAARDADGYALGLYAEIASHLGLALANAVTLLNPEKLILGGGVLSRTPVLREQVVAAFQCATNPPAGESVEVVDALLDGTQGTIGAALLVQ